MSCSWKVLVKKGGFFTSAHIEPIPKPICILDIGIVEPVQIQPIKQ
jgi:hypothetical protein